MENKRILPKRNKNGARNENIQTLGEQDKKEAPKNTIEASAKKYLKSHKAEFFAKSLSELHLDNMKAIEVGDDKHTVVFHAVLNVAKDVFLPMMVFFDDTIYTILRIRVEDAALTVTNSETVMDYLNLLNRKYKAFKYYISEDGALYLDCAEVFLNDYTFDNRVIRLMLDVTADHIRVEYPEIMKRIRS